MATDPLVRNVTATIGGPESVSGTAEARTAVLPIRSMPGLRAQAEKTEDPVIVGNNMSPGEFTVAKAVGGQLQLSPRCCAGFGMVLNSLLGQESAPTQIAACIRVRYTGGEASCKIIANTSADTLDSDIGDLGSESGDGDFGTTGSIDLTDGATDTVGELVTVIDAYTDYECEKVFGADATLATEIIDITAAQGKNRWVYIFFSSADSGYYLHKWAVSLGTTQRPTYSVQLDGMHDNYLYDGVVVDALSLSGALKGIIESDADVLGFEEAGSQVASALSIESVLPLIFSQGSVSINEYDFTYTRQLSLNLTNNHEQDGYGMGSLWRQFHRKSRFGATGQVTVRTDDDITTLRADNFADTITPMSFYFKANTGFSDDIPQLLLVDIPYAQVNSFEPSENNGVIDSQLGFLATNPDGAYSDPVTVYLITDDGSAY